jgi:predicted RNA-binding Zn-ribbon protein involved in translation (DUF1610 family)
MVKQCPGCGAIIRYRGESIMHAGWYTCTGCDAKFMEKGDRLVKY